VIAIANGCQAALWAPTEFRVQHYLSARRILEHAGYRVELLISGMKGKEKAFALDRIRTGEAHLGGRTHALIEDNVEFARLGFRSYRRATSASACCNASAWWTKAAAHGHAPHVLVLTATQFRARCRSRYTATSMSPSSMSFRPAARRSKRSDHRAALERRVGWCAPRSRSGAPGVRRVPVIEESKLELKAAMEEFERLSREVFPKCKLGLLHGRLSSDEKDDVMQRFRKNEVQILVATTVVEVGVDVPNATVMVIEHARTFRPLATPPASWDASDAAPPKSHCVLVGPVRMTDEARARLETMVRTVMASRSPKPIWNSAAPAIFRYPPIRRPRLPDRQPHPRPRRPRTKPAAKPSP